MPARKNSARRKTARKKRFSATNEVRAIARERVGTVKPAQVITPKSERKQRYKKDQTGSEDIDL